LLTLTNLHKQLCWFRC